MNAAGQNGLAVVTGASTGIGYELAKCAAQDGYDLVIAADEPAIETAAADLRRLGSRSKPWSATCRRLPAWNSSQHGCDPMRGRSRF